MYPNTGNVSDGSYNDTDMAADGSGETGHDWEVYTEAIVVGFVSMIGLFGNTFVLTDSIKLTRFAQQNVYLFFGLSISDAITCLVRCVVWIYILFHDRSDTGRVVCEIWLASSILIVISMVTNMIIAFERYLIMYKYERYKKIFTPKRTLILNVLVWILLALAGTFLDKGLQFSSRFHENGVSCMLSSSLIDFNATGSLIMRSITALVLGVCPITVTAICYAAIIVKVYKTDLERLKKFDETINYRRITYISLARVTLVTVCWLPNLVFLAVGPLEANIYYDHMRFFDYVFIVQATLAPFVTMHDTDFRDTSFTFKWRSWLTCSCWKVKKSKIQREGTKTSRTSFRANPSEDVPTHYLHD